MSREFRDFVLRRGLEAKAEGEALEEKALRFSRSERRLRRLGLSSRADGDSYRERRTNRRYVVSVLRDPVSRRAHGIPDADILPSRFRARRAAMRRASR